MRRNPVRKAALFAVMVGVFTALIIFWGAVNEARALVSLDTYSISGSISPTSTLQYVWFVGEYGSPALDPPSFFAQPIGSSIPGGTTTPFSFAVTYSGPSPSAYTILAVYPPDTGATVGSNNITTGTPWHTLFPDTAESTLVQLLKDAYSGSSTLYLTTFYAINTSILGAPLGNFISQLSLWNFEIAAPGGSVSASVVPLPAAVLLFGPGLVGLAAIRRRFKK